MTGVFEEMPFEAINQTHWDTTFNVNAAGTFFTLQAALPHLEAAAFYTVALPGLAHAEEVQQMIVPIEVQNAWVHEFSREDRPLGEVASDWLDTNPELVGKWLEGVSAAPSGTAASR